MSRRNPPTPRKSERPPAPGAVPMPGTETPPVLSLSDAYEAHQAEAAEVADARLPDAVTADLPLALYNARVGVAALDGEHARIARELPTMSLPRLRALPNLVRAAMFASSRADLSREVTRDDIDAKLSALQEIRVPALLQLQVFKSKKLADGDEVDRVVAGRGTINFAQDGVDIEHLFTANHDAWRGKHPFSDEEIAEVGRLGNWLLDHVQPDGAVKRDTRANPYDRALRALWTLIVERHRQLRTAGVVLWGEDGVDAHVPKLQLRQITRTPTTPDAPPPADPPR